MDWSTMASASTVRRITGGMAALLCALLVTPAQAAPWASEVRWQESMVRVALDGQRYTLSESDFDLPVLGLTLSLPVATGVMVDISGGRDLSGDSLGDLELRLTRFLELSLRMTAPPSETGYQIMSRLGLTSASLEQSGANNLFNKEDFSGLHFSLGVERAITADVFWSAEAVYTNFDDDLRSVAVRLGLSWAPPF